MVEISNEPSDETKKKAIELGAEYWFIQCQMCVQEIDAIRNLFAAKKLRNNASLLKDIESVVKQNERLQETIKQLDVAMNFRSEEIRRLGITNKDKVVAFLLRSKKKCKCVLERWPVEQCTCGAEGWNDEVDALLTDLGSPVNKG